MPSVFQSSKHRPRFERAVPPHFQLTDRDIEIIRHIAEYRFLRSTHLSELLKAPHKKICERLSHLYHAGFLDRPRAQIEYHHKGGGSQPIVYAVSNRGAGLFREYRGREQRQYDWQSKNRNAGHIFLNHALAISNFRVALRLAIQQRTDLTLLDGEELLATLPAATREAATPWGWNVRVLNAGVADIAVIPDYAFALRDAHGKQRSYLVEIDRGTMPVERSSLDQTSVMRKLLAYEAGRQQQLHQSRFAWKNFRVLFITSTAERVRNIEQAIRRTPLLKASPLFLLTDYSTSREEKALLNLLGAHMSPEQCNNTLPDAKAEEEKKPKQRVNAKR